MSGINIIYKSLNSKLHFIINDKGEILDFVLTPGNVNDRNPLSGTNLLSRIHGKLFGDKGYISKTLFEQFFIDGIHLITKLRKNMKNNLMHMSDKILLRKRAIIETVVDELKNICQIEHTRHRSPEGFIVNLISGLIAYSYLPKKPSLNLEVIDQSMALAIWNYVELTLINSFNDCLCFWITDFFNSWYYFYGEWFYKSLMNR